MKWLRKASSAEVSLARALAMVKEASWLLGRSTLTAAGRRVAGMMVAGRKTAILLEPRHALEASTMIKVSVMYPHRPGARFDHDYYRDRHMPLLQARLGKACLYYTVARGLAGGTPDSAPTYVAMCEVFAESAESFQAAFGPHAREILGDIAKYTDLEPVMQLSDVVVEHS